LWHAIYRHWGGTHREQSLPCQNPLDQRCLRNLILHGLLTCYLCCGCCCFLSSRISRVPVSQNHTLLHNLDTLWWKIASGVLKDQTWIEGRDGTETRSVVSIERWGWVGCGTWVELRAEMGWRVSWLWWAFPGTDYAGAQEAGGWRKGWKAYIWGLSILLKVILRFHWNIIMAYYDSNLVLLISGFLLLFWPFNPSDWYLSIDSIFWGVRLNLWYSCVLDLLSKVF